MTVCPRPLRYLVPPLVTLVILVLTGCGGDDETSTPAPPALRYDVAKANDIAHGAMIGEADLAGAGWTVSQTDNFESTPPPDGAPTCKVVDEKRNASKLITDADRTGHAQKELTLPASDTPVPTTVEVEVAIFKGTEAPGKALDALRAAMTEDFPRCIQEIFAVQTPGGAETKITDSTLAAPAPTGGIARAWDLDVTAQGATFPLRIEAYAWVDSNAGGSVFLFGPRDVLTAQLVNAAVGKTVTKLTAQAR